MAIDLTQDDDGLVAILTSFWSEVYDEGYNSPTSRDSLKIYAEELERRGFKVTGVDGKTPLSITQELTYEQYVEKKSDEELIDEANGLHDVINNADCFGAKDQFLYGYICGELEKRGYDIYGDAKLSIEKRGERYE